MTANGIADPGVLWRRSLTTDEETEKRQADIFPKRRTPTHQQTHETESIKETHTHTQTETQRQTKLKKV